METAIAGPERLALEFLARVRNGRLAECRVERAAWELYRAMTG